MPILGVLLFAGAWLVLDYVFSVQSGWRTLAEQFPASSRPAGTRVRWPTLGSDRWQQDLGYGEGTCRTRQWPTPSLGCCLPRSPSAPKARSARSPAYSE